MAKSLEQRKKNPTKLPTITVTPSIMIHFPSEWSFRWRNDCGNGWTCIATSYPMGHSLSSTEVDFPTMLPIFSFQTAFRLFPPFLYHLEKQVNLHLKKKIFITKNSSSENLYLRNVTMYFLAHISVKSCF